MATGLRKITRGGIAEMRRLREQGALISDLAEQFGLSRWGVRYHVRGCQVAEGPDILTRKRTTKIVNTYTDVGDLTYISLPGGHVAIINRCSRELVEKSVWYARKSKKDRNVYVYSTRNVGLHNLIFGPHDKDCVDHKNNNPLDNRLDNLRAATRVQNAINTSIQAGASGYRGVYWRPHLKRWGAYLRVNGKIHYFGTHQTAELAAEARDVAALRLQGEFAVLNFERSRHVASS